MSKPNKKQHRAKRTAKMEKAILGVLREDRLKSLNYKQIAAKLKINDHNEKNLVVQSLAALRQNDSIEETARGKYRYKQSNNFIEGKVDLTSKGAAYIISDELEQDIYVNAKSTGHALQGDIVKVLLYAQRKNKKPEGEIVEIVKRARTEFVGTVELHKNFAFLKADSRNMLIDIYIPKEDLKGAKNGEKAIASITRWPDDADSPFGKITEVLGMPGNNEVEMHAILAEYGLPRAFPPEVELEAEKVEETISEKEVKRRRDFRDTLTFTIDPADAKDFDDALSFKELENGNYEIGVHIADVTHYVTEGTELEREGRERATSVYLVDRVVPMLPEKLSNKVCSLRPHEEKLTFSAVFEINQNAEVLKEWFGRTVIYSDHRFAYEDAQAVIETKEGPLSREVNILNDLAVKMRAARMADGALAFDRAETKFVLDENGHPTQVYFKESKEANHLIEEFMLLANRSVAAFIGKAKDGKPSANTFVYRIHDEPNSDKLMDLGNFVKQFGYQVQLQNPKSISRSLNKMLQAVKGKAEENMVSTLTIRSMAKAVYSTQNIGHYGLSFDYYTHFTSPIRRYPDMMVHRLLQHYLDGGAPVNRLQYEELCEHSSEREKMATDAERSSIKFMQVKFMEDKVGQEFMGTITGVTEWGVFVELRENLCEGMIRIRDFKDDYYNFDERNYCIVGERKGKVFQLGDTLAVSVKNADLDKKQLDFAPV